ncbi:hypothetical protein [Roseovarius mucosus]|uniref:hypothetical protein n=1 Tax=Roseovarius mucosus TaxID=215743 RepID=UPI003F70F18F
MTIKPVEFDPADPLRNDEICEEINGIIKLVHAAEFIVEHDPDLQTQSGFTARHLLEMAGRDLKALGNRVSP